MFIAQVVLFLVATYFGYKLLNSLGEVALKPLCILSSAFIALWLVQHLP